jgi:hypothetical protein
LGTSETTVSHIRAHNSSDSRHWSREARNRSASSLARMPSAFGPAGRGSNSGERGGPDTNAASLHLCISPANGSQQLWCSCFYWPPDCAPNVPNTNHGHPAFSFGLSRSPARPSATRPDCCRAGTIAPAQTPPHEHGAGHACIHNYKRVATAARTQSSFNLASPPYASLDVFSEPKQFSPPSPPRKSGRGPFVWIWRGRARSARVRRRLLHQLNPPGQHLTASPRRFAFFLLDCSAVAAAGVACDGI